MNTKYIYWLLPAIAAGCKEQPKDTRPNIILIMGDDIAFEHMSCYGGKVPTPNIDRLAKEGMLFTKGYCVSAASTPSRYSILTGQYPGRCKNNEYLKENPAGEMACIRWNTPLTDSNYTTFKMLHNAGYSTGFVGKFHVGDLEFDNPSVNPQMPALNPDMNLDSKEADSLLKIRQSLIEKELVRLVGCDYAASINWENAAEQPVKILQNHNLEWFTNGAIKFLELKKDKPFFLQLNTSALHGPRMDESLMVDPRFTPEGRSGDAYKYHPNRKTIFERLVKIGIDTSAKTPDYIRHYNAGIIWFDDQVGCILKALDSLGLAENTIVILTADHSIEPGKSTCYERGVNVPFIVRWPAGVKVGSTCSEPVQFIDFVPTFADLANYKIKTNQIIDGISFRPALEGKKMPARCLYFEMGYARAILNGDSKLIATRYPKKLQNELKSSSFVTHFGLEAQQHAMIAAEYMPYYFDVDQIYDLSKDYYEQVNLASSTDIKNIKALLYDSLQAKLNSFQQSYDLKNTAYVQTKSYKDAVIKTKSIGSKSVSWWNRKLNYPPKN